MTGLMITSITSLIGSFCFARVTHCSIEMSIYWSIGCTCISVNAHRMFQSMEIR